MVDSDLVVEETTGKTIAQIFQEEGEASFRDIEAEVVRKLSMEAEPTIISLGGGAVLRDANRNWIQDSGWVVWLQARPETLAQRIAGDRSTAERRPSLSNLGVLEEIRSILAKREPLYNLVSHAEYNTESISLETLARGIAEDYQAWKQRA